MPSTSHSRSSAADRTARFATATVARLGSWELVRVVGEGELARVFAARPAGSRPEQPAQYALKVLRPKWQEDPRGLATLARELLVSRHVSSPHLVPILAAHLDDPPGYLAMPLLEGTTLHRRLDRQPTLDLPVVAWIARQAAQALDALHTAGWMHADVKPANLFISRSGHVTLIDLGFARAAGEAGSIAERPVLGTLNYMAPEVLYSSAGGDIRSDVYSLGVTLFEMLTGRLPFDADDVADLAAQHRQDLPSDVRSLAPHVPTRAARLVHQMLSKEPLRRPLPADVVDRLAALEIETFAERYAMLESA
ncbi:MAG: serine/threonine-protein kinase [Pirellulales bacterium]